MTSATATEAVEAMTVDGEELILRRVTGVEEYRQCETLQADIWGADDIARVPLLDMVTAQDNGGIVLGAYRPDNRLVGFVYSFPGLSGEGVLKQCSLVLAVAPEYRRHGVGYRLKRLQARLAGMAGFGSITWTVDPLAGRNVVFNLNKLGAVGTDYIVNAYGVGMGLNAGLETDRLLMTWTLPVGGRRSPACGSVPMVNQIAMSRRGLPVPVGHTFDHRARTIGMRVPWDIYEISRNDRGLAMAWREVTRCLFQHYLQQGYRAVGVVGMPDHCQYLLRVG
jgi:chorismate synthase